MDFLRKNIRLSLTALFIFACGETKPTASRDTQKQIVEPSCLNDTDCNALPENGSNSGANSDSTGDDTNEGIATEVSDNEITCGDTDTVCLMEKQIFESTNKKRAEKGLAPYKYSAQISSEARKWSCTMLSTGNMTHNGVQQRFAKTDYLMGGENIAYRVIRSGESASQAGEVMNQNWVNSPGHYANMIAPEFRFIGVGVCLNGRRMTGTQMFSPRKR